MLKLIHLNSTNQLHWKSDSPAVCHVKAQGISAAVSNIGIGKCWISVKTSHSKVHSSISLDVVERASFSQTHYRVCLLDSALNIQIENGSGFYQLLESTKSTKTKISNRLLAVEPIKAGEARITIRDACAVPQYDFRTRINVFSLKKLIVHGPDVVQRGSFVQSPFLLCFA